MLNKMIGHFAFYFFLMLWRAGSYHRPGRQTVVTGAEHQKPSAETINQQGTTTRSSPAILYIPHFLEVFCLRLNYPAKSD